MFHHPESFNNYFAGSPSLNYHQEVLFKHELEFAEMHNDLQVHLFMTAGSLEGESMIGQLEKMASRLISRNYPNFDLDVQVFENEDEHSCIAAAYMRAFRMLLTPGD